MVAEGEAQPLDIESSPLTRLDADLLQVHVAAGLAAGRRRGVRAEPAEGAAVTLVVRGGDAFVPRASTPLQVGDDLILVATDAVRGEGRAPAARGLAGGRLADWRRNRPRGPRTH